MKKMFKYLFVSMFVMALFFFGTLLADKQMLSNDIIRLHVIANSNNEQDQRNKHLVRDAVISYMETNLNQFKDSSSARNYLESILPDIMHVANEALQSQGSSDRTKVSLSKEVFAMKEYDTFALPAGVYESLRIEIGEGEGKNWWCVVFPSLCLPATQEGFADTAVSAGFDQKLVNTLTKEKGYEIRFFFLNCLGNLEKIFSFV